MKKLIVFILLSICIVSCTKENVKPIKLKSANVLPYGGPVADTSKN